MKIIFALCVFFLVAFVHGMENDMEKVIWEGWITKRGTGYKTMKKRWFELHKNGDFEYYTDQNKNKKKGQANIKEGFEGYELCYDQYQKGGGITLKTSKRDWYFYFENIYDIQFWMDFCNPKGRISSPTENEEKVEEIKKAPSVLLEVLNLQKTEFPVMEEKQEIDEQKSTQNFENTELLSYQSSARSTAHTVDTEQEGENEPEKEVIFEKQNTNWLDDLDPLKKEYILKYFLQSMQYYAPLLPLRGGPLKFNEDVVKDMQEMFGIDTSQIQQLYDFLDSERRVIMVSRILAEKIRITKK